MTLKNGEKKDKSNFFSDFVKNSIILAALDKFTVYIYTLLKNGLFGFIFGSYKNNMRSAVYEKLTSTKLSEHLGELRYGICRRIESSAILNFIKYAVRYLLGCRMKVYGTFFAVFGVYTAVTSVVSVLVAGNIESIINEPNIATAILMLLISVPLILSKKTLSESLVSSRVGILILNITGFSRVDVKNTAGKGGHMNTAFLFGIVTGALTYYFSPLYILALIFVLIWAYAVISKPEIGVLTLFFAIPFLPTMLLASIVIYVFLCYSVKLFRGKRVLRFEPVDILALAFVLLTLCGGVISLSFTSLKPALLMVVLMCGYFLTVGLIRTREWLVKCSLALVISGVIESLYATVLYFTGSGYSSDAWVDSEMFSSIGRRAVGTLDNPNMLAEYLILVIPIAVSMLVGRGEGLRRFQAFVSIAIMGACLILTWSRGAWLALMIAALIYVLMWHHRSIWLIFGGIAALPVIITFLPSSIVSRFTSIGNLSDSSTSYRVYIWRAVVEMISDNTWSGIGIGEGAWDRVYPLYTYIGVEAAPHSHNLYLQIWLELGVIGLLAFAVFIFMLCQSGFTLFSRLSGNTGLASTDISEDIMKQNLQSGITDNAAGTRNSKIQLRISVIGPMCGILAVLAQGITDYSWYNYRLFLAFWLVCGLTSSYIRNGMSQIPDSYGDKADEQSGDTEIGIVNKKKQGGGRK